jgi:hypothetical protein
MRRGGQVVEHHLLHPALSGLGCYQVVDVHGAGLADAVQPTCPLLQAH